MVNPNPFTPTERDQLRTYFGFPRLWTNSNPIFEGVLNAIDGLFDTSDAGATQAAVRAVLVQLTNLDVTIANNTQLMLGTEVNAQIKVDAIRMDAYLRGVVGPALIHQLSMRMSINPAEDYYAQATVGSGGDVKMHRLI